jgi:hypothetical protein
MRRVVGERDPAALADRLQPHFIRRLFSEMVGVAFDRQAGGTEHLREAFAEIAIGEIDKAQAARS